MSLAGSRFLHRCRNLETRRIKEQSNVAHAQHLDQIEEQSNVEHVPHLPVSLRIVKLCRRLAARGPRPSQVRPLLGQLDTHPEADLLATQVRGPWCASWACPDGVRLSHPLRRTRSIRSNPIPCCVQNRETRAGVPVSRHSGHR